MGRGLLDQPTAIRRPGYWLSMRLHRPLRPAAVACPPAAEGTVWPRALSRLALLLSLGAPLLPAPLLAGPAVGQLPVDISAERLEHDSERRTVESSGNVEISQGDDLRLRADHSLFHLDERRLQADGNVEMRDKQDVYRADFLELDVDQYRGRLEPMDADMAGPGGHLRAKRAVRVDRDTLLLDEASYTNCDCADPPWYLSAKKIIMNIPENEAVAEQATLTLHGVPIAYTPRWWGPVRPIRKDGLLIPSLRVSGSAGLELDIPYYLNLAPNRDATVTLHPTTRRGVMGKAQYRYLGAGYRGDFELHGIYDTLEEQSRGLLYANHTQQIGDWRLRGHLEMTRSHDYIRDFHQDLIPKSSRFLESSLVADRLWSRRIGFTNIEGGMAWTQNLQAPTDEFTVQHLPFVNVHDYRTAPGLGRDWWIDNNIGLINFYQLEGTATQRFDYHPTLNFHRDYYFGSITTTLGVRESTYMLDGAPPEAIADGNFYHREAGLVKVRADSRLTNTYGSLTHTIEPTVQYAMNAVSLQDDLPNYDSILRDYSITSLFADNQYTGMDRISQGHWFSYGATSRWLGSWTRQSPVMELGRVAIGQRWAPEGHREYQEGRALSDMVAGVLVNITPQLSTMADTRYNFHGDYMRTGNLAASYQFAPGQFESIGYYQRRPEVRHVALNGQTKLNEQWSFTHQLAYSLQHSDLQSWMLGLRYQHECWALHLGGGRNLPTATDEHSGNFAAIFLTFQGLGEYGIKP